MSTAIPTITAKNRLIRMARLARILIRLLAGILAIAFAWLKLSGFPLPRLDTNLAATVFLRIALVTYYFAWLFGTTFDTRDEETLLAAAPNRGRIPVAAIGICVVITVVFGVLCWVDSYEKFAIALAAFWLLNILAWRYLVTKLTGPAIRTSYSTYKQEGAYFFVEKVRQLERYLEGRWQWYRFAAGLVGVIIVNLVVFSSLGDRVASGIALLSRDSFASLTILLFVLIFEAWVWYFRIKRRIGIQTIEYLEESYTLKAENCG